jgi:hypothetical protein
MMIWEQAKRGDVKALEKFMALASPADLTGEHYFGVSTTLISCNLAATVICRLTTGCSPGRPSHATHASHDSCERRTCERCGVAVV